jgi:hypothetical protein
VPGRQGKEADVKFIASLIGLFSLVMTASAIAALMAKRRLIPNDAPDADEVALVSIFGPMAFHSTATAFRGGTVDCWYGGGVIDLRDATLDPAGAHLEVRAIFGGGQILVPAGWRVEMSANGIGAARDVRPAADRADDAPLLSIGGLVLFGGFGVSSDMPQEALDQVTAAVAKQRAKLEAAATNGAAPADDVLAEPAPSA